MPSLRWLTLPLPLALLLLACGDRGGGISPSAARSASASASPSGSGSAPAGGDGSSREAARTLALGSTAAGKLPCEAGKQAVWFRLHPSPSGGKAKLTLRTPKQGDQSCVHVNAYDASGKILDNVLAPCSDNAAEDAVAEQGFGPATTYLELRSTMGTCFPSDYKLTVSAP